MMGPPWAACQYHTEPRFTVLNKSLDLTTEAPGRSEILLLASFEDSYMPSTATTNERELVFFMRMSFTSF